MDRSAFAGSSSDDEGPSQPELVPVERNFLAGSSSEDDVREGGTRLTPQAETSEDFQVNVIDDGHNTGDLMILRDGPVDFFGRRAAR